MKTIYQPESACELLACTYKLRGEDTFPNIAGTLIIRNDGLAFEGNADVSKIKTDALLKRIADELGFDAIRIEWPTAPPAREPTIPICPDAPSIPSPLDMRYGPTTGNPGTPDYLPGHDTWCGKGPQ
jgi:hypothetical protein